ncbi:MAG: WD40 repeat domain-containing protein [Candidatus Poribacteria bacterium]|nr:WD40 repeat domain-containing protein [Candidatus Poribacteria bacterium]
MYKNLYIIFTIMLLTSIFILNGIAQEYTQWHLPEGAKARLGKGSINDIKFSSDGTLLAVATSIGVWIYDAQTGKEISLIKVNYRSPLTIHRIAFSPDSKMLATGKWVLGSNIELWDVETGEKIRTLIDKIGRVYHLRFSHDGRLLSCGSWDRKVQFNIWEVDSGREVAHFTGEQNGYSEYQVSQDSSLIATDGERQILLWDTFAGKLQHAIDFPIGFISGFAFSPDNKLLVSSGRSATIWDTETGSEILELYDVEHRTSKMTFSPNGEILVGGDYDGKIKLWNINQILEKHQNEESSLSSLLRKITNRKPKYQVYKTLSGHSGSVNTLTYSSDGKTLASGSRDGTVIVWDADSMQKRYTIHGHSGPMTNLRFLDNGNKILSGSSNVSIWIWDINAMTSQFIKPNWNTYPFVFSHDDKTVVNRDINNDLQLWDIDTDKQLYTIKNDYQKTFTKLALSPDNKLLASGSRDGSVELWDISKRKHYMSLDKHTNSVNAVLFSPDGTLFASASEDGTVQLWQIQSGKKKVLQTEPNRGVGALAFSPDSKTLVSGRWDGPIQNWDTETFQHIGDYINAAGTVNSLEFSPDGKILANGLYGLIRLWDVETKTKIKEIYKAHNNSIPKFVFSPDSKTLVSGSSDGTSLIWDLEKMGIFNR